MNVTSMVDLSLKTIIPVDQAVGMVLPHDITKIVKDTFFKGRAFRKGHIIREKDVAHLSRLGKDNIYVLQLTKDEIHENEAALLMAKALAGSRAEYLPEIIKGKITIRAAIDGLLKIKTEALLQFKMLGEAMCATCQIANG